MEHNLPVEDNNPSSSHEIPCLSWNSEKFHCRIDKVNVVHVFITHFSKTHFILSFHLYLCLPNDIFRSDFFLFRFCSRFAYSWYLPHSVLDVIGQIIFGEDYELRISLYNYLCHPITSFLLGPIFFGSALASDTLSRYFLLIWQRSFYRPSNKLRSGSGWGLGRFLHWAHGWMLSRLFPVVSCRITNTSTSSPPARKLTQAKGIYPHLYVICNIY
jgi:hypothetical protein